MFVLMNTPFRGGVKGKISKIRKPSLALDFCHLTCYIASGDEHASRQDTFSRRAAYSGPGPSDVRQRRRSPALVWRRPESVQANRDRVEAYQRAVRRIAWRVGQHLGSD